MPSQLDHEILSDHESPVLDEATFQQILAAAYVLQQSEPQPVSQPATRAQVQPSPQSRRDPAQTLSQIVETQELIRAQPYDVSAAANLIAQRLQEIVDSEGVAIATVVGDQLQYCASTGTLAKLAGIRMPIGPELSALPAQPDGSLQCSPLDPKISQEFLNGEDADSSIALPMHREGKLAGLIEIRFESHDDIQEPQIRTCQLMAGLMTEAMARASELEWRHALAAERATMLEALERIKPQLERLAIELPGETGAPETPAAPGRDLAPAHAAESTGGHEASATVCPQCGYEFGTGELFCGRCGSKRPADISGNAQSKWASLWELQKAAEKETAEEPLDTEAKAGFESAEASDFSPALEEIIAQFSDEKTGEGALQQNESSATQSTALTVSPDLADKPVISSPAPAPENAGAPWTSASKTHKWLESIEANASSHIWAQRGNIYVGLAVVLLLAVLYGWDSQPQARAGQPRSSQPRLSLMDRALVAVGLAEAPAQPVYHGNPNAQVWVDLHTALYYCSGDDLFGKTPGGRFTSQRDAQLDQFEPAARKPCD